MPPKKEATPASATTLDPTVQLQQAGFVRAALESQNVSLKSRLQELTRDVDVLRDTRTELAKDTADFLDYSIREHARKDADIISLKDSLVALSIEKDAEIASLMQLRKDEAEAAALKLETAEAEAAAKLKERDVKLEKAQHFLELSDQYEAQIESLTASVEKLTAELTEAHAEMERRIIMEKKLLERAQQAQYAELKKQARAEMTKIMDEETVRLAQDSQMISKELILQTAESRVLSNERGALFEASKTLKRDIGLLRDAEKDWAARSAAKEASNKELTMRCSELEVALLAERRARVAEMTSLLAAVGAETEDMRLELSGLRSLVALKNRELRTIKKLAQIVLRQRTEVEQFFLDALTQVKLDIAKKKKDAALAAAALLSSPSGADLKPVLLLAASSPSAGNRTSSHSKYRQYGANESLSISVTIPADGAGVPKGVTLPELTANARRMTASGIAGQAPVTTTPSALSGGGGGATGVTASSVSSPRAAASTAGARVDIAELTPEDRERVLRLLFAKINNMDANRASQQQYQQQPQQRAVTAAARSHGAGVGSSSPSSSPRSPPNTGRSDIASGREDAKLLERKEGEEEMMMMSRNQQQQQRSTPSSSSSKSNTQQQGFIMSGPFGLAGDIPAELQQIEFRGNVYNNSSSRGTPTRISGGMLDSQEGSRGGGGGRGGGDDDGEGEGEMDSGELAAALGNKAKERVEFNAKLRKAGQ